MHPGKTGVTISCRVSLAFLALAACGVLFVFAVLRETPLFWRNDGGYPLWLRDLVKTGFYPLFLLLSGLLFHLSYSLLAKWKGSPRLWYLQAALLFLCWLGLIAAISFALVNNLVNLLERKPLHHHQENRLRPGHIDSPHVY